MTRPFDGIGRVFAPPGERVSELQAMRHWLAVEREKRGRSTDGLDALSRRELLDALLNCKPGAAAFCWRARPVEWSRLTLSQVEFERLHVIEGPERLGWRALSPDGTVMGAAARIDTETPETLATETGVDVERVLGFAEMLAAGNATPALVLTKRRGRGPPRVTDGNHRATAVGLYLLRTGEYRPQRAYLGIGANPVCRSFARRALGVLDRLWRALGDDRPRW